MRPMPTSPSKKALLTALALLTTCAIYAAEAVDAVDAPAQRQIIEKTLLGLVIVTIIGALLALAWVFNLLLTTQRMRLLQEHGMAGLEKVGVKVYTEPYWKRFYTRLTYSVPIAQEGEILLDHSYDGIRELDNRMPPWWVALFYATIVVSVVYFGYQHFTEYGLDSREEYALEMEQSKIAVAAYLATQEEQVDEENVTAIIEPDELALGSAVFQTNCAVCHGKLGEGGTGPNLTDPYWLHGGGVKNIFSTIKYGVPEKGMISWKAQLRPLDMQRLSSFILALEGTDPPNAKEPQGERWEGSADGAATDSTAVEETTTESR